MDPHMHPRLLVWWKDNPADPDRPSLDHPDVQRLIAQISPGAQATDLGGVMSLNALLEPAGMVLRVHQPWVSRRRIEAVQHVRRALGERGLLAPAALPWRNATVIRCGRRWAELEEYIPHTRAEPTPDSYGWLFRAMGRLHQALSTCDLAVPRPLIATYAPPGTLLRWLAVTEAAVRGDVEGAKIAQHVRDLVERLRRRWIPASRLPQQLIHGDVRLSNVCKTLDGETVYLDFGFMARRPQVHDLAYALAFMWLALRGQQEPERFMWQGAPRLIEEYERAAGFHLTDMERGALVPYTAAVPLYAAAVAGFSNEPARLLKERVPFLRVSEWLLRS